MKYILALLIFNSLTACAPKSGSTDSSPAGPAPDMPTVKGRDITNRSLCTGATEPSTSITGPGWETTHLTDDGTEVTTKMYFFADSVSLYSFCSRDGLSTYAQVTTSAKITETSYQVLQSTNKKAEAKDKGAKLACEADLQTSGPVGYSFEGPCLKITNGSAAVVFIPR
jgi:hypothetical protein